MASAEPCDDRKDTLSGSVPLPILHPNRLVLSPLLSDLYTDKRPNTPLSFRNPP